HTELDFGGGNTGSIIAVDDCVRAAEENALFALMVVTQAVVAVHVIFADIENDRRRGAQPGSCLQLETGQLQHIQIVVSCAQQIQCRGGVVTVQVAPDAYAQPLFSCHVSQQGHYRTLAIGAGDSNDGLAYVSTENIDVAGDGDTRSNRRLNLWRTQADTRADHQFVRLTQQLRIEPAQLELNLRKLGSELCQDGRVDSAVDNTEQIGRA